MANPIVNKFARINEIRKQYGWLAVCQWGAYLATDVVCNLDITTIVWLEPNDISFSLATPDSTELRFLNAGEVEAFASDPENKLTEAFVEKAYVGNELCFAAIVDGNLASYGWYALGSQVPVNEFGCVMQYPTSAAYMYNGFTHPNFRGLRLHGIGMGRALLDLADRGVGALVSDVNWTNWASLRSCARLGYRTLGNVYSYGWGSQRFVKTPQAAKSLGVTFAQQQAQTPIDSNAHCMVTAVAGAKSGNQSESESRANPSLRS